MTIPSKAKIDALKERRQRATEGPDLGAAGSAALRQQLPHP